MDNLDDLSYVSYSVKISQLDNILIYLTNGDIYELDSLFSKN